MAATGSFPAVQSNSCSTVAFEQLANFIGAEIRALCSERQLSPIADGQSAINQKSRRSANGQKQPFTFDSVRQETVYEVLKLGCKRLEVPLPHLLAIWVTLNLHPYYIFVTRPFVLRNNAVLILTKRVLEGYEINIVLLD